MPIITRFFHLLRDNISVGNLIFAYVFPAHVVSGLPQKSNMTLTLFNIFYSNMRKDPTHEFFGVA